MCGVVDLPVTIGTVQNTLSLVVVEKLHVDSILGTDTLKAFRAIIDMEALVMTFKGTTACIPLGETRVEENYLLIESGTRVLVPALIKGKSRDGVEVLVEGANVDVSLRVARSLCTVQQGCVVVELWNTSPDPLLLSV